MSKSMPLQRWAFFPWRLRVSHRISITLLAMLLAVFLSLAPPALAVTVTQDGSIWFEPQKSGLSPYEILPLWGGNLLVAERAVYKGGERATRLMCLKPDGTELWNTELDKGENAARVTNLTERHDGTVTLCLHRDHWSRRRVPCYNLTDGSLVWQGEERQIYDAKEAERQDIYISYSRPAGERLLREEAHDFSHTTHPVYYQLEDMDGAVLWREDAEESGLGGVTGALAAPQGTMVFGDGAMMLSDTGERLWYNPLDVAGHTLWSAWLVAGDGKLFLIGAASNAEPWMGCDMDARIMLDIWTGETLWTALDPDRPLYINGALEIEQGYLLAGQSQRVSGSICYQLLDFNGNEQAYWETEPWTGSVLVVGLYRWQGKPWVLAYHNIGKEMTAALHPVEAP